MRDVLEYLKDQFNTEWLGELLVALLSALLVGLVFYGAWFVIQKTLKLVLDRTGMDETARRFMITIARYTVGVIALITILGELDILNFQIAQLGTTPLTVMSFIIFAGIFTISVFIRSGRRPASAERCARAV